VQERQVAAVAARKETAMDGCANGMCEALQREMRRRREQQFIQAVKTIRLELMLIAAQDRVRELEHSEWARLEEMV
jgi:hypothetical protein